MKLQTHRAITPEIHDLPDTERFNRVYRLHVAGLTAYARKFAEEGAAADIVHDVFVMVWSQKRYLMPEAQIRFFLYRCVLNACRNHLKHESRKNRVTAAVLSEMRLEELDFAEANLDKVFDEFMLNKVYKQIGALPPKCREIFEMSYLHQKKTMKIAEELGISRRTVETQLYKALKFLRGTLLISIVLIFI